MKKKILSLALALVLCLGLAAPAFAAAAGDTAVTDANGVTYRLSSPILRVEADWNGTGETLYVVAEGATVVPASAAGYEMTEADGFVQFQKTEGDSIVIWSASLGMGLGGSSLEGITVGSSYEENGRPFPPGYVSEHWKDGEVTEASVYFLWEAASEPAAPVEPAVAMPTNDRLTVNGALQNPTVYKIDGNNYFKIRDLAAVLNGTEKQFDVGYDAALKSVTATTGKPYAKLDTDLAGAPTGGNQTADPSNDAIYIDGQKIDVTVYKINGSNYFKLRDLGKALNFYVGWTREDGVFLDTSKPYSE